MLVIQFAKLLDRRRKLRSLDFPSFRPALGGVQDKLEFVRLVNRHGTAPCSHGLKGQRATFLLAVLWLAIAMPQARDSDAWSGSAFGEARRLLGTPLCNSLHRCGAFVGKTMHAVG
jgi:hypothetical protein